MGPKKRFNAHLDDKCHDVQLFDSKCNFGRFKWNFKHLFQTSLGRHRSNNFGVLRTDNRGLVMRIVMTFQDRDDGNVMVKVEPNCKAMVEEAVRRQQTLTPAQQYALRAVQSIVELSKKVDQYGRQSDIILPDSI
jgi:hypothetical protein